jgi:PAS domain S-box-containing protein
MDQRERLQRMVQSEAAFVQRTIQENTITRSSRFADFVRDFRNPQLDEKELDNFADSLFMCYPSSFVFARIDRDLTIQWIKQRGGWTFPNNFAEFGIREELSRAINRGTIVVTQSLHPSRRDQSLFVTYIPKEEGIPNRDGFLILFRSSVYLNSILNMNIASGYAITLSEDNQSIFSRSPNETQFRGEYEQNLPIKFEEMEWKLSIWPTAELVSLENTPLPRIALGFGFLTTLLLALGVYFAQIAWSRAQNLEREMSERQQIEEALRTSETRYRSLLENLEHGVALKDSFGRYLAINKVFGEQIGRTPEEIIGKTDDELFPESLAQRLNIEQQNILMEDKKYEIEEELELRGEKRQIRRISTPQREDDQSIGVLSIWWDVTDQRKIESCLAQAGKIEAIGQLAGGIAHDFNNLLTAIIGNLDIVLNGSKAGKLDLDCLSAARTAALRGSSLTNRLLGFSRRHQLNWIPCALNLIVDEVFQLLQRTVDPRIKIQVNQCPKIWHVQADPGQMNQVLMNLCLNARDAIDGSGTIKIETNCLHLKEVKQFNHPDATPGYYVRLSVTDSGCGMTPEVRAHIFEPFFTTKEVGKGTGLGLAMVFGIVKQHKGWIECTSEVNRGTRFDIYLPRTDSVLHESTVSTPRPVSFASVSQTILVVDDEAMLRQMVSRVLKKEGFFVLEAEDGQEAIEIYQREQHRIDLVILDLTMPRLSGQDAFRIMRQMNPEVKVLFTSGYAEEQISSEEKQSIMGFIEKPYRLTEVVRIIREIFHSSTV